MLALVLSENPLSVKQFLPESIVIQNQVEEIVPIPVTTYEQMITTIRDYYPRIILIFSELVDRIAYEWIPEVLSRIDVNQTVYVYPKSELDGYHLQTVISELSKQQGQGKELNIHILSANLIHKEIGLFIGGILEKESDSEEKAAKGHVITLIGPGSSGVTMFSLYYVPYLAELFPHLKILMVDMNEQKRDLAVATNSQNYRLTYYLAQLQTEKPFKMTYQTPYAGLPNLSAFSAVQDQYIWSPNEIQHFLDAVKKDFDLIFIDRGEADLHTAEMTRLMQETDELIYLVRADGMSISRTKRFMKQLKQHEAKLIITHFQPAYVSEKEISKYLSLPVLGCFPYQRKLIPIDQIQERFIPSKLFVSAFQKYKWKAACLDFLPAEKKKIYSFLSLFTTS